jgi:phenylacetate-CoA ligase
MSLLKAAYARLSPGLQRVALEAHGVRQLSRDLLNERLVRFLEPTEYWSANQQKAYVGSRLRVVLSNALRNVPAYSRYSALGSDLQTGRMDPFLALAELPIIKRSSLVEGAARYHSRSLTQRLHFRTHTSGTTGAPLTTRISPGTAVLYDALSWRRTVWAGWRPGDWIARLVGDPVVPLESGYSTPPYRVSLSAKRIYLSAFHLSEASSYDFLEVFRQYKPAFLMAYPSAGAYFARWLEASGVQVPPLKAFLYSSEPLHEHQRGPIARVFGQIIRGFYGNAERVLTASECEVGSYHLSVLDGYVEGQFDPPGDSGGSALVTTLRNSAMPLIRYDIGDSLRVLTGTLCSCGRTLPVLDPIMTKDEDGVKTMDGRYLTGSVLTWCIKDLDGITACQIVQEQKDAITVYCSTMKSDTEAVNATLASRLRKLLGPGMGVTVRIVERVPVTNAGKGRFVVNTLPGLVSAIPASSIPDTGAAQVGRQ